MEQSLFDIILIASIFCFAFFAESLIGFGGLLISFSILSFFINIKDIIPVSIYVSFLASVFVLMTNCKSINFSILFKNILPLSLVGTFIGLFLFSYLSNEILLKILSGLLIFLSLNSFLSNSSRFTQYLKYPLLAFGGIMNGLYGIIGPFVVAGFQNDFKDKVYLRSTLALFFTILNVVRMSQLTLTKQFELNEFFRMWWVIFPLGASIFLGYYFHLKISESFFKKAVNVLLLFAGIVYLFR